jgi:hypothetical protein
LDAIFGSYPVNRAEFNPGVENAPGKNDILKGV